MSRTGGGAAVVTAMTATIEHGVKTNRVRVQRKAASAGTAMRRFKKDPATRGLDVAIVCVSLPVGELALIDAGCEELQMARSHLLREAAKAFIAARRKA